MTSPIPDDIREASLALVQAAHDKVYAPSAAFPAKTEIARDAVMLRVKLSETRDQLDSVLKEFTMASSQHEMSW